MNHYKMLQDLLERPIAFQRPFVDVAGSVLAGLMLSQAYYWTPRTKNADGWFYKTQEEWEAETGMSRYEQEGARKKLRTTDFWQEELRGVPAKLFFRVDTQKLYECLTSKYAEEPHPSMGKNHILDRGNSTYINTETSSETSSEKEASLLPSEEKAAPPPPPQSPVQRSTTPFLVNGLTAGQLSTQHGKAKKYCQDYDWRVHRDAFEAIVNAMGKRALVDADDTKTISDWQQVAVTLTRAGQTAETIQTKTPAWKDSYWGKRDAPPHQFISFMGNDTTPVNGNNSDKHANVINLFTLLENANQ